MTTAKYVFNPENCDKVTGLLNRDEFQKMASKRIRTGEFGLALIWFNIDNFKIYNELFGYVNGTTLLREVSEILKVIFPIGHNLISRFSDDNFVVMSTWCALEDKIEAVQNSLYRLHKNITLKLRAGIYFPSHNDDVLMSCDKAKIACDTIRKNHSIKSCMYQDDMSANLTQRQYILDNLSEAFTNNYIKVLYQPIVRILTGKICEAEALTRWEDPKLGYISPHDFITTLEQYKEIHRLDIYVLNNVCQSLKARSENNLPLLPVSINLSRLDFELCDIFQEFEHAIAKNNISRNMLKIEITESVYGNDMTVLDLGIEKFRANGYEVWMDDFGSGYSSLNALKDYHFDTIKFDMKFLSGFNKNSRRLKTILSSNLSMAKQMGIQTLAEGVETKEQYEYLQSIGFEKAQGYFFGRAMDLNDVFKLETQYEDFRDAEYYSRLGKIEMPSQDLMHRHDYEVADVRSMALLEFCGGEIDILAQNKKHAIWILQTDPRQLEIIKEFLKRIMQSRTGKNFYIFSGGNCLSVNITPAASNLRTGAEAWLSVHYEITRIPKCKNDTHSSRDTYNCLREILDGEILQLD